VIGAQASCLWGNRESRLVSLSSAGKMPAGPTAKMAVLRCISHETQTFGLHALV
jgi:hypothetical protein